MSKLIYAIVAKNGQNGNQVHSLGSTADYTRYTAYLMYLSRLFGVKSSKQFAQFYYSYYYNPEWKLTEQYCNKSLPQNKMTWFDPELTAKLAKGQIVVDADWHTFNISHLIVKDNKLVNVFKYQSNPDYPIYLAKVKVIGIDKQDNNQYYIAHIIKPQEIWQAQHNYQTWQNILWQNDTARHCFKPDLTTFAWRDVMTIISQSYSSGAKTVSVNISNPKKHLRHLAKANTPRNYAVKIKQEYNLPCLPKHMTTRQADTNLFDIYEHRVANKWHRHESWKNHKIKHQYEQHLSAVNS